MWHRRIALALGILAAALLAVSGLGVRAGLWPYRIGLGLFSAALVVGLAAFGAAGIALAIPRLRAGWIPGLVVALLLGAAGAAVPLEFLRRLRTVPLIHDITTDPERPPQFVAIVPLRAGAPNPHEYQGAHIGELQRIAYPELRPLEIAAPPAQAFARARAAARALGWEIVGTDESAGRIEAVATTFWFGFKDDVVIRVVPAGSGSRIDVRSKSRVGRGDVGANAKRIQEFLTRLKNP
jgi:uncharacterized protein (DUF1499 family)